MAKLVLNSVTVDYLNLDTKLLLQPKNYEIHLIDHFASPICVIINF